jgi:hypothetical protein
MDVDVVHKASTEEQKKKHRTEGRCFECSKQGHMARQCPNKKQKPQQNRQSQGRQSRPFNQRHSHNKPNFRTSFARIAELMESDNDEDPAAEDSDSEPEELNISDLVARTARFSDEDHEKRVTEMKKPGADF